MSNIEQLSRRDFLKGVAHKGRQLAIAFTLASCNISAISSQHQPEPVALVNEFERASLEGGKNPVEALGDLYKQGAQLIGIGEYHGIKEMVRLAADAVYSLVPDFIALEVPSFYQRDLEKFVYERVETENFVTAIDRTWGPEYRRILEACRKTETYPLCTHPYKGSFEESDTGMRQAIYQYLDHNPGANGIFYAGRTHVLPSNEYGAKSFRQQLNKKYVTVPQMRSQDFIKAPDITEVLYFNPSLVLEAYQEVDSISDEVRIAISQADGVIIHPPQQETIINS